MFSALSIFFCSYQIRRTYAVSSIFCCYHYAYCVVTITHIVLLPLRIFNIPSFIDCKDLETRHITRVGWSFIRFLFIVYHVYSILVCISIHEVFKTVTSEETKLFVLRISIKLMCHSLNSYYSPIIDEYDNLR